MTTYRIVLALLVVLAAPALSTSQDRRSADFETLEGTWVLDLNAPPTPPAQLLTTFARGGTIIANGNNAQPVLRSSWHGVWARRNYFDFSSTWRRWNFDAAGAFTGANEFRMDITVERSLETFIGTVEILTLDRTGTVTASRMGTFRATRVNVRRPAL
jgi:hypothetical protein